MTEIRYVDWGLANNFGSFIELNKHLKNYPKLHDALLEHERKHTNQRFSKQDFVADLTTNKIENWVLIRFMLKHPKSLLQLAPFYWQREKGFVYDINAMLLWGIMFIISGGIVYLTIR